MESQISDKKVYAQDLIERTFLCVLKHHMSLLRLVLEIDHYNVAFITYLIKFPSCIKATGVHTFP